jgi:hypothetical protein
MGRSVSSHAVLHFPLSARRVIAGSVESRGRVRGRLVGGVATLFLGSHSEYARLAQLLRLEGESRLTFDRLSSRSFFWYLGLERPSLTLSSQISLLANMADGKILPVAGLCSVALIVRTLAFLGGNFNRGSSTLNPMIMFSGMEPGV